MASCQMSRIAEERGGEKKEGGEEGEGRREEEGE